MATVIGDSGAWQAIVMDLAQRGHSISEPRELSPLLLKLEGSRPQLIDARYAQTMLSVGERKHRITTLASERGFFRRLFNRFKIRTIQSEIAALRKADSYYVLYLDQTIARVRSILDSGELAGAEAELAVIDQLRTLSSSAVVFNDVRLKATRHIYYEGATLISAQIDHIVVTPAGVFVVETKRWSRRSVESGDFHNPFDQINRANYLCYDLLRGHFGKTRVRSVIACAGSRLEAPPNSYIKVIRPENLKNYISGFRNAEITPERFHELCRFFENRSGGREF